MQGPVYGVMTDEAALDDRLFPNFHYDDLFGTVVNGFVKKPCAIFRLQCMVRWTNARLFKSEGYTSMCRACLLKSSGPGELRIFNQLTETFSVNELAQKVSTAGQSLD